MGRAFEFRKERKMKRWGNMSKVFTRIGKEITMAAKSGGPDPEQIGRGGGGDVQHILRRVYSQS